MPAQLPFIKFATARHTYAEGYPDAVALLFFRRELHAGELLFPNAAAAVELLHELIASVEDLAFITEAGRRPLSRPQ